MGTYNISGVGRAEVDKKELTCDFNISADAFFSRFSNLADELSSESMSDIRTAIDSKKAQKYDGKKYRDQLEDFFSKVESKTKSGGSSAPASSSGSKKMGFGSDEAKEQDSSQAYKEMDTEGTTIHYKNRDSSGKILTKDHETGEVEGEIILGEKGAEGLPIPIEIIEKIEATYEFNAEEPKDDPEARKVSGLFKIKNPSSKDHIWDVDIFIDKENAKGVDIPEHIKYKNIDHDEEQTLEYKIQEFQTPPMKIKEFISTLNDENTETYALSTASSNVVLFRLNVNNTADYPLNEVVIKKEVQEGYQDTQILETSLGTASIEGNEIVWKIDQFDPGSEAVLKLNMSINIAGADVKARTGKVSAEYKADSTLTGLKFKSFDAYSNNFVGMEVGQKDDDPDMYEVDLVFQNKSDFQIKVVNLDIVNADTKEKVIDIDPHDIEPLASGAKWVSLQAEVKTTDGIEPMFYKLVEFFVLADHIYSTMGTIAIEDIELAVAMMKGQIKYSVTQLPSFRVEKFEVVLHAKNTGGADLNDLIMEHVIQAGFLPPKPEEIELFVVRPPEDYDPGTAEDDPLEVKWDNPDLGEQISLDESLIEITPNDQEPTAEHTVKINLTNLRDNAIGMFLPGMIIRAKYPLTAFKVAKDTEYISNVKYTANTYPAGAPMEVIPEGITIPVIHIRKKLMKGKTVRALPEEGNYEIILSIENMAPTDVEQVVARDVVPSNFEYADFSIEPGKYDSLEGKDLLVWTIDKIASGAKTEIKYKITGKGDYKASDSQFSV
jgi:hypothetical protein